MVPFPALATLIADPKISALLLDPAPALVFDSAGNLRFANRAAVSAYGAASLDELIQKSAERFGEMPDTAREFAETLPAGGPYRREAIALASGTETFRCERLALQSGANAVLFTGLARERSDGNLVRALATLVESESAPFAMFDANGKPLHANKLAAAILGSAATLHHINTSAGAALTQALAGGKSEIAFGAVQIALQKIETGTKSLLFASFSQPQATLTASQELQSDAGTISPEPEANPDAAVVPPLVKQAEPPRTENVGWEVPQPPKAETPANETAPVIEESELTEIVEEVFAENEVADAVAEASAGSDADDLQFIAETELAAEAAQAASENNSTGKAQAPADESIEQADSGSAGRDATPEKTEAHAPEPAAHEQEKQLPVEPVAAAIVPPLKAGTPAGTAKRAPSRFVWQLDADGKFVSISADLAEAVGADNAARVADNWNTLIARTGMSNTDTLLAALLRRDTWSGVTVLWPVAGTQTARPVDLAALPVFNRERQFTGYRGFGVFRDAVPFIAKVQPAAPAGPEAKTDNEQKPAEEKIEETAQPVQKETPSTDTPPPLEVRNNKVIRIHAADPYQAVSEHEEPKPKLDPKDEIAFREIGRVLGKEDLESSRANAIRQIERAFDLHDGKDTPETPETEESAAPESTPEETPRVYRRELNDSFKQNIVPPPAETPTPFVAADVPLNEPQLETAAAPDVAPAAQPEDPLPPSERALLDKLPLGIAVHRGDKVLYANRTLLGWLGIETAEALGKEGGVKRIFSEVPQPEENDPTIPRTLAVQGPNNEPIPVETRLFSMPWYGVPSLVYVLRRANAGFDERRETIERALRAAEASTREQQAILDTATDGVLLIDRDGKIGINKSAEALFGFDFAEIQNSSFTMLFAPESHRAAVDYLDSLASNGVASVLNDGREVVGRERKGGLIPLFMTLGKIGEEGQKFCAVLRDITQRKRAEEELTGAPRQAELASSHKSDFLAKISHEMRTPLNAIIGFAEVMMQERFGPIGSQRYRDYLKDIHQSGEHLISLINDLLDLSKIEAGKLELEFVSVDLNEIARQSMALMQPQANRERVIIRSALATNLPPVVADARSIRQIVLNLLSNSVKFTKPGGQVILSTSLTEQGEVVLRVRDTGVGMTEEEIAAALEPFRQLATSGRDSAGGTGLGLPLTKALVEANRATFHIKSAQNAGTLIEVSFPSTRVLAG